MGGLSAGGQDSWPLHGNRETGKFPVHELRSLHRIFFHGNRAEFPEQIMAREQRRLRKHRQLRGEWRDGQYRVRCGCRKLIRIRAAHCRSWRIRWPAEFRVLLVPVRAVPVQPAREFWPHSKHRREHTSGWRSCYTRMETMEVLTLTAASNYICAPP